MLFVHTTRESDVSTFTGIEGPEMFKAIFEMLKPKAQVMTYYDRQKKTLRLCKRGNSAQLTQTLLPSPNYNLIHCYFQYPVMDLKIRLNLFSEDLSFSS